MGKIVETLVNLGGFAGIAAVLAAIPALRKIGRNSKTAAEEARPNHGSSMRDAVIRIEATVQGMRDTQKAHGHQLGEIKQDSMEARKLLADRLNEHGTRLENLEKRK